MKKKELAFLKQKYDIIPRKQQGQNFLLDTGVIDAMIAAAELSSQDTVLEIGPGFGILTTALASCTQKVITVEQDRNLARAISDLCVQYPNVTIYNEDIRTFHRADAGLLDREYHLIANLPYSISSWIFREFFEHTPRPKKMVLMVQDEVAKRLTASPGSMSVLSVVAQLCAQVEYISLVPPESFSPQPKVNSAIIRCTVYSTPLTENIDSFLSLVKSGFSARRKTVINNLKGRFAGNVTQLKACFEQAGISPTVRPQELSIHSWELLRKCFRQ